MKKIIAVFIALLMAAVMPASMADGMNAEDFSVTYTGSTVDASGLNVGDYFYFYVSLSDNSAMWSGHWLIDYPEQYITPTASSTGWSGSVTSIVQNSINNNTQTSDLPSFVCSNIYEGMTGSNPYGEAGNLYTVVGMYLSTFSYGGLQQGGNFVRVRYKITELPDSSDLMQDENGYYFEMPITVRESRYWIPGAVIDSESVFWADHENVTVINGKVYIKAMHTVNFYDINGQIVSTQRVINGDPAVAPTVENVVMMENGPYVFYGWDAEFDSVTGNMDIHPLYTLIGDVDFNEVVDSVDALMALRASLGIMTLNARETAAADIDFNGEVRSDDALKILRLSLGIIDSLL